MKRDERLYPLSWNHHAGLVFAHRLKKALDDTAEPVETLPAIVEEFWNGDLKPHFAAEEEILLPAVLQTGDACKAELEQMLDEHRQLRGLRDRLRAERDVSALRDRLAEFAEALIAHIRFEERVLFPEVERVLPQEALDRVGVALAEALPSQTCQLPEE